MTRYIKGSAGGKATARVLRERALREYNLSPNLCRHCAAPILVPPGGRVRQTRVKLFCGSSCSARYWAELRRQNKKTPAPTLIARPEVCPHCARPLGGARRTVCLECSYLGRGGSRDKLGVTKAAMKETHKGYQSFRAAIQRAARAEYVTSGRALVCAVCGYATHVDICHLAPVAAADDSKTLREINSLSNLVALCKNHHWELDHGHLPIDKVPLPR